MLKEYLGLRQLLDNPPDPQAGAGGTPPPPPPAPPKEFKLEDPSLPDSFKGKSQKEIVDMLISQETELERMRSQPPPTPPKPSEAPQTEAEKKAAREREFINDPVGFMERHYNERTKPLTEEYFRSQATIQKEFARGSVPNFSKYEKDIDTFVGQMPPEARANPAAYDWAYKMARYPDLEKQEKEWAARGGMISEGGGGPAPSPPTKVVLDEEEKVVAKRFGMSDEDFIKYKNRDVE